MTLCDLSDRYALRENFFRSVYQYDLQISMETPGIALPSSYSYLLITPQTYLQCPETLVNGLPKILVPVDPACSPLSTTLLLQRPKIRFHAISSNVLGISSNPEVRNDFDND